ncbi:MAG: SCP2 sterol-binding domain-containing protein [Lachnospiraceae bacterium]|nr:SCP2 sterol-binding domain-containing protein [Lachnospiraceae bacterium]
MTYEEVVAIVQKNAKKAGNPGVPGHVAIQINIEGEAEGAFYVEFSNGKLNIMPYEYYDRDLVIFCHYGEVIEMARGILDPMYAYETGRIWVEGNVGRLNILADFIRRGKMKNDAKVAKDLAKKESKKNNG